MILFQVIYYKTILTILQSAVFYMIGLFMVTETVKKCYKNNLSF